MNLWLLRHAKSSWDDPDLADDERPLAKRGERAAARMRRYLIDEPIEPELVLCSSALRARETLAGVLPALGSPLEIRIEPSLYTFDADVLLELLQRVDERLQSMLVVGHNPAMQDLILRLARRGEGFARVTRRFSPGALAGIWLPQGTWTDGAGELVRLVEPRELKD